MQISLPQREATPPLRWRYFEPGDPVEEQARARIMSRISRWWADFAVSADRLDATFRNVDKWDAMPAWVSSHLGPLAVNEWEFGPGENPDEHCMMFSGGWDFYDEPLVHALVDAAPRLPGWKFKALYPPMGEHAAATFDGRQGGILNASNVFDLSTFRFRALRGPINMLMLRVDWPGCESLDRFKAAMLAMLAVRTLLGEEIATRWMAGCRPTPTRKPNWFRRLFTRPPEEEPQVKNAIWLEPDQLLQHVVGLIKEIESSLPLVPLHEVPPPPVAKGAPVLLGVKLPHPIGAGQAAGCGCSDLHDVIIKPQYTRILEAMVNGQFTSRSFSRVGETFCFLKLTSAGLTIDAPKLGVWVDQMLRDLGLGCVIWAGNSDEFHYVALALPKVNEAMPALRALLQDVGVDRQSWLLFFDRELGHEWLGVWPDSPPPKLVVYKTLATGA